MNIDSVMVRDPKPFIASLTPEKRDELLEILLTQMYMAQAPQPEPICMPIRKYCEVYGPPEKIIRLAVHSKYKNQMSVQRDDIRKGTVYVKVRECNKLWLEGKLLELV